MNIHRFPDDIETTPQVRHRRTQRTWPLHRVACFTALAGTLLFFLPVLGAFRPATTGWPGYLSGSDTLIFYFPSFMAGYFRFWGGGISGIDFATNGGASVFALRANMMPFYPPYILSYLIFDISNYVQAAVAYTLIQAAHLFACLYFCVLLGRRYLGLSSAASVLFATLYGLTFLSAVYFSFATFFFQMTLVPVMAYAFCRLLFARRLIAAILVSPLIVTHFLTNYAPTMGASLFTAMLICFYVWFTRLRTQIRRPVRQLYFPMLSIAIAIAVTLPYYIGQIGYFKKSVTTGGGLVEVAISLAFTGRDLFSAISQSIKIGMSPTEGRLVWGLIPIAIWLIGLAVLVTIRPTVSKRFFNLIAFGLAIYLSVLAITMGPSLPGADIFYYGVPIFGSMHVYQRFLLFAQIFLALSIAALSTVIVTHLSQYARLSLFIVSTVIYLSLTVVISLAPDSIDVIVSRHSFMIELFMLLIAVSLICLGRTQAVLVPIAVMCAILGTGPVYDVQKNFGRQAWGDYGVAAYG